nr:neural Wiskott-Aldrich syndrome protein-like [Aegilops tauschii subsp. strangulata]
MWHPASVHRRGPPGPSRARASPPPPSASASAPSAPARCRLAGAPLRSGHRLRPGSRPRRPLPLPLSFPCLTLSLPAQELNEPPRAPPRSHPASPAPPPARSGKEPPDPPRPAPAGDLPPGHAAPPPASPSAATLCSCSSTRRMTRLAASASPRSRATSVGPAQHRHALGP